MVRRTGLTMVPRTISIDDTLRDYAAGREAAAPNQVIRL
jgi:hypothetical protein